MKLLYCSSFMFSEVNGETFALPSCADPFFQKYLDVFDSVRVLGVPVRSYLDTSALVKMTDSRISVRVTLPNSSPIDFRNDAEVKRVLQEEIASAEAVLIKPASRRGIIAVKIAEALHKPYMIEMTGDIHNALMQHPNLLKRMYAPFFYRQIKHAIRNCKFGLYVSKDYLQKQFPIDGLMCGCADVILQPADDQVLARRISKIDAMQNSKYIDISLIGFYQGKMKGVDTAIRALSKLPSRFRLNILGNGTQQNRDFWYKYAESLKINNPKGRIQFPKPLPNACVVLEWLDTQDFFILPTRSEGFGRCVAEAMSRGCICFATNICTMPELLEKECLHPLGDGDKLANLILSYASNPELMKSNAERNFKLAKNYDFEVLRRRRNEYLKKFRDYCENGIV